jgi:LAO/AO transport system kinase
LARGISFIENEKSGYEKILENLPGSRHTPIIGITGPPGSGKSTLTDGLIAGLVNGNKRLAVLCIDPSSPFNLGALLGDRVRMSNWYNHPDVFIRSLATRGSLGGLHPKIIEISELVKAAPFDYVIIETVGVGQSEIEIAGLADATVVVLVPEAGDEIQVMKAGLMEIADVFVINKSDRPGADMFEKNLQLMVSARTPQGDEVPVIKTIATDKTGIPELWQAIEKHLHHTNPSFRQSWLLTERAYQLISKKRMKDVNRADLNKHITTALEQKKFNLYSFVQNFNNGQ